MIALAFASPATVLPAFAAWLGAPTRVVRPSPAVLTVGWFLPCLFAAPYTEGLARKLPFLVRWTLWERVPFLVLAAAAYWMAEWAPGATLAVLLAMLLMVTGVGGLLMPAWMDLIGRAVPMTMRGRFFAVTSVVASIRGLGAGGVADRAGHVVVVITGVAAAAAANALALGAPSLGVFGFVFVLSGVQQASASVSGLNVLLEFAPAEREGPTYLGLGQTSLAPVAFMAPLVGCLLAVAAGFTVVLLYA